MKPNKCIFTGDSVTITCTCELQPCIGNIISVLKNGQDVDNGKNIDYKDPCRAVHTFQANFPDDFGANIRCSVLLANLSVVQSEPGITIRESG